MKKNICLILLLLMMLSLTAFADTAENEAMSRVLETVKERIGSTEKYDRLDSRTSTDYKGNSTYHFTWSVENGEKAEQLLVTATESGIITRYYLYGDDFTYDNKPSVDRKTSQEVRPAAEAFLKKINPHIYDSLVIKSARSYESLRGDGYEFTVSRMENHIPVMDDTGYISLSPDGNRVQSFSLTYTEGLSFEKGELISAETARKNYAEKLGLKLYYISRVENGVKTVIPVYNVAGEYNEYISAVSGQVFVPVYPTYSQSGNKLVYGEMESTEDSSSTINGAAGSFTDAEKAELEKVAGLISYEDVLKLVKENKVLKVEEEAVVGSSHLSKDFYNPNIFYWNIFFEGESYGEIKLDARTGRVISFYKSASYTDSPKVSAEKAKDTAFSAIANLAEEFFPQDGKSPYQPDESTDGYTYYWTRYENGIPFPEDRAYVRIDKLTGEVVGYQLRHEELSFPALDNVISPYMAFKMFFESIDYSPAYIKSCSENSRDKYDLGVAVYLLEPGESTLLDAETGEQLYKNESVSLEPYKDISGHFSETAANTLRSFGIGFEGGAFKPDEIITQKELAALLSCVFDYSSTVILRENFEYADAYNIATRKGIIFPEEKAPDSPVTRELAAIMLIRAMGLEQAAALEGIYNCPFTDVTENKGYISILGAMGVFSGDGSGRFNPMGNMTRAEAAVVLYNYLSR